MNPNTSVIGLVTDKVPNALQRAKVFRKVRAFERRGFSFVEGPGSLELLIKRTLSAKPLPFSVSSYHISLRSNDKSHVCEAIVKVKVGNRIFHEIEEGDGPLNALDKAIRTALTKARVKGLHKVALSDYLVRMLNSAPGTAAKTSVLIQSTNGKKYWWTIGVSHNVIEASLQALVDSIEYALVFG